VEIFDAMFAVNVKDRFSDQALPADHEGSGRGVILNMSSICGLVGHRYTNEAYTTNKGALTLLTKSVAVRYAKDNIRCNSIHPSTWKPPSCRPCSRTRAPGRETRRNTSRKARQRNRRRERVGLSRERRSLVHSTGPRFP